MLAVVVVIGAHEVEQKGSVTKCNRLAPNCLGGVLHLRAQIKDA